MRPFSRPRLAASPAGSASLRLSIPGRQREGAVFRSTIRSAYWCSRQESNLHYILRKDASYPLNDESVPPTILENLLRGYLASKASLHARGGVLLDEAALHGLIDRLLRLGEDIRVLGLHQLFDRILHGLRAARIEHATAEFDAVGFLS